MECIKASELLCGTGKQRLNTCNEDVCMINSLLRTHYSSIIETKLVRTSIGFVKPLGCKVEVSSLKGESIYKVHGVYIKKIPDCSICSSQTNECLMPMDRCNCGDNRFLLPINRGYHDMDVGGYQVDCDKVTINVGHGVESGYVIYSRGPKPISSMDDEICLDPREIELLTNGMQRLKAESEDNPVLAEYYDKKRFNSLKRLKESEQQVPFSISYLTKK